MSVLRAFLPPKSPQNFLLRAWVAEGMAGAPPAFLLNPGFTQFVGGADRGTCRDLGTVEAHPAGTCELMAFSGAVHCAGASNGGLLVPGVCASVCVCLLRA